MGYMIYGYGIDTTNTDNVLKEGWLKAFHELMTKEAKKPDWYEYIDWLNCEHADPEAYIAEVLNGEIPEVPEYSLDEMAEEAADTEGINTGDSAFFILGCELLGIDRVVYEDSCYLVPARISKDEKDKVPNEKDITRIMGMVWKTMYENDCAELSSLQCYVE